MTFYALVLFTHSYVRWLVLAMALTVLIRSLVGWQRGSPWTSADEKWHAAFVGIVDLQFTLGLLLYVWLSPVSWAFFGDVGGSMKDPMLRFFGIEHIVGMIVAVTVIHIARDRSRHAASDRLRHRKVWISTLVAILIVAASIPWPVLSYARPLFR